MSKVAHAPSARRPLSLRRSVTDPLSPLAIGALMLTVAVLAGTAWPVWILFAAVAGYSLSGST